MQRDEKLLFYLQNFKCSFVRISSVVLNLTKKKLGCLLTYFDFY